MSEKPQHVPKEQLPEYWDGHSAADDCSTQPRVGRFTFEELLDASDYGEEVLKRFLSSGRALTRVFKQGEVVRAKDLKNNTVLRLRHERLIVSEKVEDPYAVDDYWGVVCEAESGERLIMGYFAFSLPDRVYPATVLPDPIHPEEVMHRRPHPLAYETEQIERFQDVSIYTAGEVTGKRIKFRLPDFRRIFRRQAINHS
ncbi:MAG: hypothetical protein HYT06_01080 [Candidatus Levybacteria bacterium]|nr:hypothetical protein [Candidatus Levybacteria bacterium]